MIVRKLTNFVLNEACFAAVCGQSGEKHNEVQDKICRLQPIGGILNMLLTFYSILINPYSARFE